MTIDPILMAGLTVLLLIVENVWLKLEHSRDRASWARERRELCDRLQSGTLPDYIQGVASRKEIERAFDEPEPVPEEEEPAIPSINVPGPESFASARESFRGITG